MKAVKAIQNLQNVLKGAHPLDEQFLCSLNVLTERLEKLKQKSLLFEKISFSDEVDQLAERAGIVAAH